LTIAVLMWYCTYMTLNFMEYKDPRKVLPLLKLGKDVRRHADNPLVQDAPTDAEKKVIARALSFHEQRKRERAEDDAAEALEASKRTFLEKVWHVGVIFCFGQVPDAASEVMDRVREVLKNRKR